MMPANLARLDSIDEEDHHARAHLQEALGEIFRRGRGLDSVSRYFGIEIENRHRAGGDARATATVLLRLLELAAEQGAQTLEDLGRVDTRVRGRKTAGPGWVDAI